MFNFETILEAAPIIALAISILLCVIYGEKKRKRAEEKGEERTDNNHLSFAIAIGMAIGFVGAMFLSFSTQLGASIGMLGGTIVGILMDQKK
ncbi:MAG: hypothetical protein E7457_05495 [Ruminococcaceae bacterium]|nr:hypothetical protein [Oscillospiraceae bacterium]